jgi:hypothetical protein
MTKRAELWRRQFLAAVLGAVTFGALALGATPAFGAFTYSFERELAPSSPFGFLDAGSVAVNDANDQTYVADSSAGVVHVFQTSTGTQLPTWDGSALSNPPGTPAGSFGGGAVSVSANNGTGAVFVVDQTDNVVDEFDSAGSYVCQITGSATPSASECNGPAGSETPAGGFSTPRGITVDQATGEIFVLDPNNSVVDVFSLAGAYLRQISLSQAPFFEAFNTRGIAVSDFNGHVYVSSTSVGARLYEFDASGNFITSSTGTNTPAGSFGSGFISVAADDESGAVFVTESQHAVTDVFNPEGEYLTQFSHSFGSPRGTAVDQASHKVYVSDDAALFEGPGAVDIFAPLVIPDVTTEAPSQVTPAGATLNGKLNPLEVALTDCHFDWGTSSAYGQSAQCSPSAGEIPADSSDHAVSAQLTNLAPDTTYHYRLQAANANGANTANDVAFTTAGAGVHAESVTDVAATSVTFNATIDPNNAPTSYYFQYSTTDTAGCTPSSCATAPAPPGQAVGSGEGDVQVEQPVHEGLVASTVYHYRVVVLSELKAGQTEPFYGPDQTFTTQGAGAAGLLDGRAWEMVSPPDKHGADLFPLGGFLAVQGSADGGAMTYAATAPTEAAPEGFTNSEMQVLSRRTPQGWRSQDIGTPHSQAAGQGGGHEYLAFSGDLSQALLQPFGTFEPSLSAEASEQTAYLRTDFLAGDVQQPCVPAAMHCYRPLVTGKPGLANVPEGTHFGGETDGQCVNVDGCGPRFVGGTPDLSHLILSSTVALTQTPIEASPAPGALYEWASGTLRLVSVLPEGGEGVDAKLGDLDGQEGSRRLHVVSNDGSRVVWAAFASGHLYVRDAVRDETVQLDAVQGGSGEGSVRPHFQFASSDGSKVLFTAEQRLTEDSGAEPAQPDLYECDLVVQAGKLRCVLSDLTPLNAGEHADVRFAVLGASEDASWVFFVAEGVLAEGAAHGAFCEEHEPVSEDGCKLYVRHGGVTRFVAALSPRDKTDWSSTPSELTSRVSPDGRWLAFMSQRNLTGYDNRDALNGRPDEEVYLYYARSGRLTCGSCNPTAARPVGEQLDEETKHLLGAEQDWGQDSVAAIVPGWTSPHHQSRYLSDNGRLFFESRDALVPQDANGTWDVYEYEPPGVGGCTTASAAFSVRSGGCVGLISSGTSPTPSAFFDASASGGVDGEGAQGGGDVFFVTRARLSPQDFDTSLDVYDAHECTTSSPCLPQPVSSPPPCITEASCKAAPSPQPGIFGAPASASFSGRGNIAPSPPSASKPPTRAQKLAKALSSCRKKYRKSKKRRTSCERSAHRLYRAKRSHNASPRKSGAS